MTSSTNSSGSPGQLFERARLPATKRLPRGFRTSLINTQKPFWWHPRDALLISDVPMRGRWELTDEQWEVVEPVLRPNRRADRRGRPWHDTRAVLHGVLWVLGTGAQWRNCQKGTRLSRPAPADSSSGCGAGYWKRRSGDWRGACMSADSRTWTRRSWMPPSRG